MSYHKGSDFDDFLAEEEILEQVSEAAEKRLFAWQLRKAMEEEGVSEAELARRMETSRSSVRRLFSDTVTSMTLETMRTAARSLHREVSLLLLKPEQVNETNRMIISGISNKKDTAAPRSKRAGRSKRPGPATAHTRKASAKEKRAARPSARRRKATSTKSS